MAYSQRELGERFKNGETSGTASNVTIRDYNEDFTALIGYGHACYAIRDKRTGEVFSFMGWDRYSQSTTQQYTVLGLRGDDVTSVNESPSARDVVLTWESLVPYSIA